MASTLVAAFVRGEHLVVFNAGDSRAYLLGGGHARRVDLATGAVLLLCSDGLTEYVTDAELGAASGGLEELVESLFTTAMERGGEDNLSLVAVARAYGNEREPR